MSGEQHTFTRKKEEKKRKRKKPIPSVLAHINLAMLGLSVWCIRRPVRRDWLEHKNLRR